MKNKKWIAGVLAFMLAMSASGCGAADNEGDEAADEVQEAISEVASGSETTEEGTEDTAVTESDSENEDAGESDADDATEYDTEGTVGETYIKFVEAEYFINAGGLYEVRFYYDYTNLSDEVSYAKEFLYATVTQDGEECSYWYVADDNHPDEVSNHWLDVSPDDTIRCVIGDYVYDPDGGDITVKLSLSEDGEGVGVTYTVVPEAPTIDYSTQE